ncbi:DUF5952 family protein [Chitinophaga rhizophila]|uniref:Uncharacterized protein n=1 Tax=Chitinophaga rhizophila TaxID=2866212 RepID=A0ABS7GKM1_9BACT|nr:DUF5952 family protein [Chitinophaga rhizophila]MBW8688271.1 hypothetical protein [Chitinophaga rhizophila]
MEKYLLKIDCDVLNEMGLTVNRMICAVAQDEPAVGDVYCFLIGEISHPITIKVISLVAVNKVCNNSIEVYCCGEEIDEDDDPIKERFAWQTFSID